MEEPEQVSWIGMVSTLADTGADDENSDDDSFTCGPVEEASDTESKHVRDPVRVRLVEPNDEGNLCYTATVHFKRVEHVQHIRHRITSSKTPQIWFTEGHAYGVRQSTHSQAWNWKKNCDSNRVLDCNLLQQTPRQPDVRHGGVRTVVPKSISEHLVKEVVAANRPSTTV